MADFDRATKRQKQVVLRQLSAVVTGVSDLGKNRSADGSVFSIPMERAPLNIPSHATNLTARLTKAIIPNSWETVTPVEGSEPNYTETGESFVITQQQVEMQKTWTAAENDFTYGSYGNTDVPARQATRATESYNAMLSIINPGFYYDFENTGRYIRGADDRPEGLKPQHEQGTAPEGEMTMRFTWYRSDGEVRTEQPWSTTPLLTETTRNNYTEVGGLKFEALGSTSTTYQTIRGEIEGIEQLDTSGGITIIITGQDNASLTNNTLFWISDSSDPSYANGDNSFEILHGGTTIDSVHSASRDLTSSTETFYDYGYNNFKISRAANDGDNISYAVTIDADGNATVWTQQVKAHTVATSLNGPIASCGIGSIKPPDASGSDRTDFIFSKVLLLPYHCDDYQMTALIDMMVAQTGCNEVNQRTSNNDPTDFGRFRQDQRAAIPVITMGDFTVHNWAEISNNYQGLQSYGIGLFDDMDAGTHQGFSTLVKNDRNQQFLRVQDAAGYSSNVNLATNIYYSPNSPNPPFDGNYNAFAFDDDKLWITIPFIRSRYSPDGVGNNPKKLADDTSGHYSFNINASDSYTVKMVEYVKNIKFSEEFAGFKVQDPTIIVSIGEEEARGITANQSASSLEGVGDDYIEALLEVIQYILDELPRVQIIIAPPLPRLPSSGEMPLPGTQQAAYSDNAQICLYISQTLGTMIPFQNFDVVGGGTAPTMFPDTDAQRVRLMYHCGDFMDTNGAPIRRYISGEQHPSTTTADLYFDTSTSRFGNTATVNYALYHSNWNGVLTTDPVNDGLVYQIQNFISEYYTAPDTIEDVWSGGHIGLKYETGGNETERYGLVSGKPANEWHIYKAPSWDEGQYFYTREEFYDRLIRDIQALVDNEYSLGRIMMTIQDAYQSRQFRLQITSPIQAASGTKLWIDINYYLTGDSKRRFFNRPTQWDNLIFDPRLDLYGIIQTEKWINYHYSNYVNRSYTIDVPTNLYYDQNNINSIIQEAIASQYGKNGSKVTTDEPFLWIPEEKSVWNYQLTYSGYAQIGAIMTKHNIDDVYGAKTTWNFNNAPVFRELLKLPLNSGNAIGVDPGFCPLRLTGGTNTANRGGTEYFIAPEYQFSPINTSAGVSPLLVSTTPTEAATPSGTPIFLVTNFTQGGVNQRGDPSSMLAMIPTSALPGETIVFDGNQDLMIPCAVTLKGNNPQLLEFRLVDKDGFPLNVGSSTSWSVQCVIEWEQEVQQDYLRADTGVETAYY